MRNLDRKILMFAVLCVPSISARAQVRSDTPAVEQAKHTIPSIQDTESPAEKDQRMKWFREARFGMFVHWGLYAVPAGQWKGKDIPGIGEWIMNRGSVPVSDYGELARDFNPVAFDAHTLVGLAKAAGMKYIIITAKHHDGFAMFDSKADGFNIVKATPYGKDPVRALAAEAQKQGIKLGFYYSQYQDWTAPGGGAYKTGDHEAPTYHWDKAQDGDFNAYLRTKAIPQIQELLTNYGVAPAVLWFDTPGQSGEGMTPEGAGEIVNLLNKHKELIWNNRLGGGYRGDTETPEQYIPAAGYPGRDWESCMTINDTWGYKSKDLNFKSTETLLRNLVDIASKGGNYLLNVGPDAQGNVPPDEVKRLREVGQWMAVNGSSIYATTPTLFGPEAGSFSKTETGKDGKPKFVAEWKWRSTTKANRVYIHLFEWPNGTFQVDKMPRVVTQAYLLADPKKTPLKVNQKGEHLEVSLPARSLDSIATVLVLETRR